LFLNTPRNGIIIHIPIEASRVQVVLIFVARPYKSGSRQRSYPSSSTTPNRCQLLPASDYRAFLALRPTLPQHSEHFEIRDITSLFRSERTRILTTSSIYQA
jgi:hypothetical protein